MARLLFVCFSLAACSDSRPAPLTGDAAIDMTPTCPMSSTLKVTLDGTAQPEQLVSPVLTVHSITLKQPPPGYVLMLTLPDDLTSPINFPSPKEDLTFGYLKTSLPVGQIVLKTKLDTAENVFVPTVAGTLSLVHLGGLVGDNRCGALDLTLTWSDTDPDHPHATRLEGGFTAKVDADP